MSNDITSMLSIRLTSFPESREAPRNYYIWGYQSHFRISAKCVADRLFSDLNANITPSVFLVAVKIDKDVQGPEIVIEPEDHEIQSDLFRDLLNVSRELEHVNPGPSYAYQGNAEAGKAWIERESQAAFRSRVKHSIEIIIKEASHETPLRPYVSLGRECDAYLVHTVLLVREAEYVGTPRLHRMAHGQFSVETSLIDAVAHQFVEESNKVILTSFAGAGFAKFPGTDTFLRASGRSLMYTPSSACLGMNGHDDLFSACSEIATLTYERSSERGRLIFARPNHDAIFESVTFRRPVRLGNSRAIRKLLQLTNDNEGLLCDSCYARGVGAIRENYNPADEDIYSVNIMTQSVWELVHNGMQLMRVEHGLPKLPKRKLQLNQFNQTLRRLFPETSERQRALLSQIAGSTDALDNGAVLIITSNAADEANRFGAQATVIEPIALSVEFVRRASRIDGAILASPDGRCHAIGVILDGHVNRKGTSERGARYNSTVRYVLGAQCPCLGVIVSDDGMVDLIPEYHPMMSRRDVERAVATLKEVANEVPVDEKRRSKAISVLRDMRFYLSKLQCEEINGLRDLNRLPQGLGEFRVMESEFSPNPDMNDSFFLD